METENAAVSPDEAYALAPDITREITWIAYTARDFGHLTDARVYWLRKAAVFDRIALAERERTFIVAGSADTDADAAANDSARRLIDHDRAPITDAPRDYVRREYARWSSRQ